MPSLKIRHFNPISVLPAVTLTFDLCSWHWACTWGHRWRCYIPDFIILGGLQVCQTALLVDPTFLCAGTAVGYISQWGIGAEEWLRSIRRCVLRIHPIIKPKTSTGRWGRPASAQLGFVWVGWILVLFFNYRNRGLLLYIMNVYRAFLSVF